MPIPFSTTFGTLPAIQMGEQKIGEVYRLSPENLEAGAYCISPHHVNFAGALKAAKRLGMALPQEIVIFAIGVGDVTTLSEDCAPQVKRAVEVAVEMVTRELEHAYSKN